MHAHKSCCKTIIKLSSNKNRFFNVSFHKMYKTYTLKFAVCACLCQNNFFSQTLESVSTSQDVSCLGLGLAVIYRLSLSLVQFYFLWDLSRFINCSLTNVIITWSVLRRDHKPFQSEFSTQYDLVLPLYISSIVSLKSSSSFLRLLPRLLFHSIFLSNLPSTTCVRRQFLHKM